MLCCVRAGCRYDPAVAEAFDEAAYLQGNPDVARAVAAGVFESGLAHYESHGRAEGRLLKGYRPLPFSYKLPDFEAVLSSACDRLAAYNARGFRRKIAPDDDMVRNVEDPAQHYFETGQSALQVILRGLILA